ncbi:PA3496 family putative envelope integrity protein [Kaarinaea lacus]
MNLILSNEIDISAENGNTAIQGLENVPGETVTKQTGAQQYNLSARRRIEDYLENKRLASLTMDYFAAD